MLPVEFVFDALDVAVGPLRDAVEGPEPEVAPIAVELSL
jgi:hypothetical protein